MDQPIAQAERKSVGILMLLCPYCDNLEPLRDSCWNCCGFGHIPGPRLYAGDLPPATRISRANLRNVLIAFAVMFAFGAAMLAWKMGWL